MTPKKNWSLIQILLLCSIAITVGTAIISLYFAGTRLKNVEANLENTLVNDFASSAIVLEQMADVVRAAEIAAAETTPQNLETLKNRIRITQSTIDTQDRSRTLENSTPSSVIRATVTPALTAVQNWLNFGVSGHAPQSRENAQLVFARISAGFQRASFLNRQSYLQTKRMMAEEQEQLNRYVNGIRLLFVLTFAFTVITITLFIRQLRYKKGEDNALQAVQQQSDLINTLLADLSLGVVVRDKDEKPPFVNQSFTDITGYTAEDIQTRESWFLKAYPDPEYRQRVKSDYDAVKNSSGVQREYRIVCKNGSKKDIEFNAVFLSNGRSLITLSDITERKKADQRLHYFKTAVEYSADAIGMSNPSGKHWFQNRSFNELFGDIGDDPPATLYVDESVGREVFKTIMAGGQWTGEVEMYSKDRNILDILLRAYAIKDRKGQIIGLVGTHTDMTRQKQAERALAKSEQEYRAVVENTPDLLYRTDLDGVITFISSSVTGLSGYTVEEATGMKIAEEIYANPEERRMFLEKLRKDGFVRNFQARLKRKDGSIWWAATNAHFFTDTEGNVMGVEGITRDITDIRDAEAALRESEERLKVAGMTSYDLIYEWNVKTDSLKWFGDIDGMLGVEQGEISEDIASWLGLIHPEDLQKLEDAVVHHRTETDPIKYEYRVKHKDDSWRYWADNALPILDEEGLPVKWIGVCTDITERKALEAQSEQAQKMESLGTLAGGIAHDFNNLLSGIFGYVDLARKKVKDSQIEEYLTKAFNSSERARSLTHQLLTFSKGGSPIKNVDRLVPFLQETVQFALSGSNVTCTFEFPDNLWVCDYDKNQISQVIDNIVINAHHAMPSGGNIRVSAQNLVLKENEQVGLEAGHYVKISISDAGIGIPDKYLSRIFDPFFTTKQKGSGLGLATGYSIIKRHDGIITVDSEVGSGSTFHVFLPAADTQDVITPEQNSGSFEGSGSILIMDDEEMVHLMLGEMLEDMGFDYTLTSDGEQALKEFRQSGKNDRNFDAIILDLTIRGGMGGKETVKEIRKLDPAIPVFVSSGYSEDDAIANPEEFGFTDSLKKPFGMEQLANLLEKHLKKAPGK